MSFNNRLLRILLFFYVLLFCYIAVQVILYVQFGSITGGRVPILLWWTPFMTQNERVIRCSNKYECVISSNRTNKINPKLGAFLFYGSHIENHDYPLPRNYSIPWAVLHEESPKNYAPFLYKGVQKLFNLTSTFSRKSHFALTLQYLEDAELIKDVKYYIPVEIKNTYLNNISPVLYIQSNCDTPSDRDHIVGELSKYVQIDSYGNCLRNKDMPEELLDVPTLDLYNEKYLRFISKYKFIVAIENALCEDYVTEKLWRPLIVGSIPIYHGSPSVKELLPNHNSAIILDDFDSIAALGSFINKVNQNNTMYNEFLKHKDQEVTNRIWRDYQLEDNPVSGFECFVCEKVHEKDFRIIEENIYDCFMPNHTNKNTWDQHWRIGYCQAESLLELIRIGKPYSTEIFEKTWLELLRNGSC